MSIFGLPLILFKVGVVAAEDMSDIQFLAIKEFDGKVRSDEGELFEVVGDLATLTANTGKDMYLASAKCVFFNTTESQDSFAAEVGLSINGVVIETARYSSSSIDGSSGFNGGALLSMVYEFKNIGRKVLAGEIIKIAVTDAEADIAMAGFIECWEEDTGESPQIPPLSPV